MHERQILDGPEPKTTRTSVIYGDLRSSILDGSLRPGTKLNVRDLSAQFDTGLSPVREALNRLAMEGLADHTDNRGFFVPPVSVPELQDLTQARCWMNDLGIRRSIEFGDAGWEEQVLLSCHRLSRTPRDAADGSRGPDPAWNAAHKSFHQALVSACGSNWLIETCSQLYDSAERYRSLARLAGVSRSDPRDEHHEIMTAALDRDADRAATLLTDHFQRTAQLVQTVVGAWKS
ncbi:GntR family transcriptional regulator [Tropicimonas aquimaris]|uniref:GntR family transcriptional regulator n=1 Tax=Tropicimonas aquimaris TaxID=914152 RepID=A0ABW3ISS5_9RHOB